MRSVRSSRPGSKRLPSSRTWTAQRARQGRRTGDDHGVGPVTAVISRFDFLIVIGKPLPKKFTGLGIINNGTNIGLTGPITRLKQLLILGFIVSTALLLALIFSDKFRSCLPT